MAPKGTRRITANPHANGGLLRHPLELPDFRGYAVKVEKPGQLEMSSTDVMAHFLRDVMKQNMTSFRVFGRMKPPPTSCRRSTKPVAKPGWKRCCRRISTVAFWPMTGA